MLLYELLTDSWLQSGHVAYTKQQVRQSTKGPPTSTGNQLVNLPPPADLLEANIRQIEAGGYQPISSSYVESLARDPQHHSSPLVSIAEGLPSLPTNLIKQVQWGRLHWSC